MDRSKHTSFGLIRVLIFLLIVGFHTPGRAATGTELATIDGVSSRNDGSAIEWRLEDIQAQNNNRILLIAHGSGCGPALSSASVRSMAKAAVGFATLTIEKYGVSSDDTPRDTLSDCSDAYLANHTVSQRVADAQTVLTDLKDRGLWQDELYLFGGSEGGAVVSILSHEVPETDAVIVVSTGAGMSIGEFFPMLLPPDAAEQMQSVFSEIRDNPGATGIVAGNSIKWWRDILDRRLSDDLLQSTAPVLIVHGVDDQSAPVETARATRAAFEQAGQLERLTYWELADRNHVMADARGRPHMKDVLQRVVRWMAELEVED